MAKTIEQRIAIIEEMIIEIHSVLVMGKTSPPPGLSEYRRAIEALVDGDKKPLADYMRNGGKILSSETVFPNAAVQRGGSGAQRRRSTNLTTDCSSSRCQ